MKKVCLLLFLAVLPLRIWSSDPASPSPKVPFVESTWPGVQMQIPEIDRLPGNRLLVVVRLWASPKAPLSTLIGDPPVAMPENNGAPMPTHFTIHGTNVVADPAPPKDALKMPTFPTPFSLRGSTMTDDLTQQKYGMLSPSPTDPIYRPSTILTSISPGRSIYMTIQFAVPPPPPIPPGSLGPPTKQTVTFLLTNAKGPITHVPLPPLKSAPKPKN